MEGDLEVFSPRRGTRQRKLSQKASEFLSTHTRRSTINEDKRPIIVTSASESESDESDSNDKPLILHENEHVTGDKIFTFQVRKKCETMIQLMVPKTPQTFRTKFKKDIAMRVLDDSSEADFSGSDSEYVVSDNETESEATSGTNSDGANEPTPIKSKTNAPKVIFKQQQTSKRITKSYRIKTEDYFSNHASKKILTSNHTLDKLETPRLSQDELQKLLARIKLSTQHSAASQRLKERNRIYFEKWMYLMHENINILLYGLGSKKDILNIFHEKYLKKLPTIVVNGFFPSLSIKDVLDGIILNLLELKETPANVFEACELVEREFSYISDTHLYLLVHNIDLIRNGKAQTVFARLSTLSNIHLIATIEHINAPLIWDHSKLSKFKFTWWDVTTFQSYTDETLFEGSMMVQRTGTLALSSLRNVFLSLTSNSKGLAFKDLYSLCREAFLVSSDLALRAQLTEFVDHKMVKYKRSPDGTEYVIIPIANTVLQQFLTEQTI
ncbi:hypothetical protein Zmor_004254 [Zophobas morio]|uniref:Origin recognition complex subunit 2 n=1 Tax=Zophobas morio TaxID=2755281 RepID=A0AA38HLA5_9CUCU|nr:hypothetical protein Zmor_004254 [Zophobas morio]